MEDSRAPFVIDVELVDRIGKTLDQVDDDKAVVDSVAVRSYDVGELEVVVNEEDGVFYPAVGAVSGRAYRTEKLRRFGYLHLHAPRDSLLFGEGWSVPAHEFHYWDSTRPGDDLTARKASSGAEYLCAHTSPTLYAGFPHLYYYSNPQVAARFVEKCMHHKEAENHGTN